MSLELAKQSLRPSEGVIYVNCIDDRYTRRFVNIPDNLKHIIVNSNEGMGYQIPGASAMFLLLAAATIPDDRELDFAELYDISKEVHDRLGIHVLVHADDHHGKLSDEDMYEMVRRALDDPHAPDIKGCGAEGFITGDANMFNLPPRVHEFFKGMNLTSRMIYNGAKVMFLGGNHADRDKGEAQAVEINNPEMVLDRDFLEEKGVLVYGHNSGFVVRVVEEFAKVLREKGYNTWAENMATQGVELERGYFDIANRHLTGRDPVVIG